MEVVGSSVEIGLKSKGQRGLPLKVPHIVGSKKTTTEESLSMIR